MLGKLSHNVMLLMNSLCPCQVLTSSNRAGVMPAQKNWGPKVLLWEEP